MLYFVATLSRYVLVEAADADQARTRALPELQRLYDADPPPGGQPFPITIRTSRPATPDEIETWKWFQDKRLEQHNLEETSTMQPPETPEERIADVLRLVAMRLGDQSLNCRNATRHAFYGLPPDRSGESVFAKRAGFFSQVP